MNCFDFFFLKLGIFYTGSIFYNVSLQSDIR